MTAMCIGSSHCLSVRCVPLSGTYGSSGQEALDARSLSVLCDTDSVLTGGMHDARIAFKSVQMKVVCLI